MNEAKAELKAEHRSVVVGGLAEAMRVITTQLRPGRAITAQRGMPRFILGVTSPTRLYSPFGFDYRAFGFSRYG